MYGNMLGTTTSTKKKDASYLVEFLKISTVHESLDVYLMTMSWSLIRDSRWPSWLVMSNITAMVLGYVAAISSAWFKKLDAAMQSRSKSIRYHD